MAKCGYHFYLGKCLLPIAPSKLQIKINSANKMLTLMDEGQINILKTPELTDIEFECDIPQVEYPFAIYTSGFESAAVFLDYFEELKKVRKPFQFIVSRAMPSGKKLLSTNIKVSMEDYTITEQAGNGFDYTVKIKLKQYRDYGTKTVNIKFENSKATATVQQTRAAETSPAPANSQTYTVANGDCLWSIAKYFYGDGTKYTAIYHANNAVIGNNPNLLCPGQTLVIPAT